MLSIIDKYILKDTWPLWGYVVYVYSIGIVIDVSEKVNKMIENKFPFCDIAIYYYHLQSILPILYFPIFLFLSIIWFTQNG
jgi:lipopolysaccharide export system permease protein